ATIAETTAQPWLDSLDIEVAKLRDRLNREKAGKEVNGEVASVASKLAAEGDARYFAKPPLLPQYVKLANQYCKSAENEAVAACKQFLDSLNLAVLPGPLIPTVEDLPVISQECFTNH